MPVRCNDYGCGPQLMVIVAGAAGGAYAAGTVSRRYLTGHRGSIAGATVGSVLGFLSATALPLGSDGLGNLVAMPVLAVAGGAVGYRYGPGARGPARRTAVSAVPVAAPGGAGVYAVVRF